jgi:glucokinase
MKGDPSSLMWGYVGGDIAKVSGLTAFECAKKGDKAAQATVGQYIRFLGEGLINFINIFRPEAIVLGGGLSGQREALTDPVRAYLEKEGYGFGGIHAPKVDVLVSELGNDAGIYGAAALVMGNVG